MGNPNYNLNECDVQVCDDSSIHFNSHDCEDETCLTDNVNYNQDECDAQVCDGTSDYANDPLCDDETCLKDNVNYEAVVCFIWKNCAELSKMEAAFPSATKAAVTSMQALLAKYGDDLGLDTPAKLKQFLAQAAAEGDFQYSGESEYYLYLRDTTVNGKHHGGILNTFGTYFSVTGTDGKYKASDYLRNSQGIFNIVYATVNGNKYAGDGFLFRGRGPFQLTGRGNYQEFQNWLNANPSYGTFDIMTNPDLLITNKDVGILSSLWFFQNRVLSNKKLTITDSTDALLVSKLVNGGKNGLPKRISGLASAKAHIKCDN